MEIYLHLENQTVPMRPNEKQVGKLLFEEEVKVRYGVAHRYADTCIHLLITF